MVFGIGDVRVAARGEWLLERMVATGSLVVRKLGGDRAGEVAVHRFLSSPYVSVEAIVGTLVARTAEQCRGRRIVAIQDTTEINYAGRARGRRGLGPAGNGRDPGFFLHPVLAVDLDSEAVIGLAGAQIWTRGATPAADRRGRGFADKESARWQDGCSAAATVLAEAAELTMIADRESDIYELFCGRPERLDLLVRAAQDRCLVDGGHLFEALADAAELGRRIIKVPPRRPGETARTAELAVRAGPVRLKRPKNRPAGAGLPDEIGLTLVEAVEIDPPDPKEAIVWRLLTTREAGDAAAAAAVIDLYRMRWRIEQVFRALKSDGMRIEDSQLLDAERLFVLATWGSPRRCARCSSSMPETAVRRPATESSTPRCSPRSPPSRARSKAGQRARRTRTRRPAWPSSPGSSPASAAGTATTNRQGQRPCVTAGPGSPLCCTATPSPQAKHFRESRSPLRGRWAGSPEGGAQGIDGRDRRRCDRVEKPAGQPPSALPGISPARGEITLLRRRLASSNGAKPGNLLISPLAGETGGSPEGGPPWPHPSASQTFCRSIWKVWWMP